MKKLFIYISFSLLCLSAMAQLNPQPKKITEEFFPDPELEINTPAFQKKKGFTDYEEMMAYLNDLQSKHPELMSISFIGESQKGKKIPMVKLQKQGVKDPVRVWIQGGLHGNEPGSTESTFFLIVNLLEDKTHAHLLDRLSLAIVPMANIDGYERHDRYAANGLDLNRDQTKFSNPESIHLKEAFNAFNPEVALDLHEYNAFRKHYSKLSTFGITSPYDAMFLYTGNLNVPENMRKLTDEVFVEKARRSLNQHYLRHHPYFSTTDHLGEIQLRQGATSPRSSATSFALTNCVSTLLEVRGVKLGRTSFKRRVYSAYLVSRSFLQTAYEEEERLRAEIARANLNRDEAVVETKRAVYKDSILVLDLNSRKIMPYEMTVRDGLQLTATKKRVRPLAYIIPKSEEEVLKRLRILGLELHELKLAVEVDLEAYEVTEYQQEAEKFEDIRIQNVKSEIRNQKIELQTGDFVLPMDQQRANLAIEVLEPEAKNSFVAYEVVPTELKATLPYYRCTQTDVFEDIKKMISND
jgi:hypothetical protein